MAAHVHPSWPGLVGILSLVLSPACASDDPRFGALSARDLRAQHCDPARKAVSYDAALDGTSGTLTRSDEQAPIACFQLAGVASAENTLAVLDDGTVLFAPVITDNGTGILRSRDHGETWETCLPQEHGGASHDRTQPNMFVEHSSGRTFLATAKGLSGTGFALSRSDDGGDTFSADSIGEGTTDWIKFASGPSLAGPSQRVIYASAPAPISTRSPLTTPLHQQVQRSRDNGLSWEVVGGSALSLKPADHGCADTEWVIYGAGVVDVHGTLYLGLRRCTRLGIAISKDEGETWTVNDVPGANLVAYAGLLSHFTSYNLMTAEPLATDSDGNLYALWNDEHDVLRFAVSKDGAASWSAVSAVAAPGVVSTIFAGMAVKEPGTLAIAYYGSTDAGSSYDAYVGESLNALDGRPHFWSQQVNGAEPLFSERFDMGYADGALGGDLVEMAEVRYAPNGDIWAGFVKDMCPGMDRTRCTWDPKQHANGAYQGAIARLVHP